MLPPADFRRHGHARAAPSGPLPHLYRLLSLDKGEVLLKVFHTAFPPNIQLYFSLLQLLEFYTVVSQISPSDFAAPRGAAGRAFILG